MTQMSWRHKTFSLAYSQASVPAILPENLFPSSFLATQVPCLLPLSQSALTTLILPCTVVPLGNSQKQTPRSLSHCRAQDLEHRASPRIMSTGLSLLEDSRSVGGCKLCLSDWGRAQEEMSVQYRTPASGTPTPECCFPDGVCHGSSMVTPKTCGKE